MTCLIKKVSGIIMVGISTLILFSTCYAAGPGKIAKANRSLWPYPINSPSAFDFASHMEMLVFTEVFLQKISLDNKEALSGFLGLKKISVTSVNQWRADVWGLLIKNFNNIKTSHPENVCRIKKPVNKKNITEAAEKLKHVMPENLIPWYQNAKRFYSSYLYEQMRLAALFPRITSEIMTLDTSEVQGFTKQDKSFLLTFDDGPTTKNGNTDKLISTLKANHVSGHFFILGERLKARLKNDSPENLKKLYTGMTLGSHGMVHKSHAKYKAWQQSLDDTKILIDSISESNNKAFYFRPPYGQRTIDVVNHLKKKNACVMLWNIDSQDWNKKISAEETADRVVSLMLLWRSGIILYHDVHAKATTAMPIILKQLKGSGINWI